MFNQQSKISIPNYQAQYNNYNNQNYIHQNFFANQNYPGQYNNNLNQNKNNSHQNFQQKQNYPVKYNKNNSNQNNYHQNFQQMETNSAQYNNNLDLNYKHQNSVQNKEDLINIEKEAFIDNLKEEENKEIGFDWSLLKREELHVNLIHFDLNITNKENYAYYNKFKVDVVGGYIAMDNLIMLINYLEAIKNKNIPFIVISTGFSGKDVIPICKKYPFIKEVIIFCGNYNKYIHYLTQYPGFVKKIFVNIIEIYKYIKNLGPAYEQGIKEFRKSDHLIFPPEDIKMDKQLEQTPVISAYEYDNCYFLIHKAYANFFGDMNDKKEVIFTKKNFKVVKNFINNSEVLKNKATLISHLDSLVNQPNFAELAIKEYTKESGFCYIFNRIMRQFEKGLISLAYYMGPFLLAVNKYVKENPKYFAINQNMTLNAPFLIFIYIK